MKSFHTLPLVGKIAWVTAAVGNVVMVLVCLPLLRGPGEAGGLPDELWAWLMGGAAFITMVVGLPFAVRYNVANETRGSSLCLFLCLTPLPLGLGMIYLLEPLLSLLCVWL